MKIYCAGPLFTPYQREFTSHNAKILRDHGFECFVPHEHGETRITTGRPPTAEQVFIADYGGLSEANAVVALLDGPDISSGTACEIGIFYVLMQNDPSKKGILGLLSDSRAYRRRAAGAEQFLNLFSLGCIERVGKVCQELREIVVQLERWRKELEG
ncbi:MAG: nucleoside 2-deoxyribosyltransferase [Chloroflexi bacterium]|nr:nucleoside 2-deoxyribosyltransferase [Chloroflexota bacterium]MCL5076363.1 nucleoside 2-deoxyribosyltransferase [Chloroflexota bacterium]